MNLGSALVALGERESGTVRLTEAITAFREVLQESTRARVPLLWAMTQMNLGGAVESVETGEAMLARQQSPGAPAIGLASLDLVMPDLDGMTGLARLWQAGKTLPIIFETS